MKSLYRHEIKKLEDQRLQLRYILGGFNRNDRVTCGYDCFWTCDIRCSCTPVEDDEKFQKVENFVLNHHISNSTFLKLLLTHKYGSFIPYEGGLCQLTYELDLAIEDYNFRMFWDKDYKLSDLNEDRLVQLVLQTAEIENSPLNIFLTKYNLLPIDFMILAKTSINSCFKISRIFEQQDLPIDLIQLLNMYNLYNNEKVKILENLPNEPIQEHPKVLKKIDK